VNSIHSIDNYLDTVCSCIKHREVHEDIKQELRAHLEDIVAEEISSGKSPDEALKAAVYSMGDPISVGSSLNSVHKPRFEWTIGAILCGFLIIALITMQSLKGFVLFENLVRDTIAFSAIGIVFGLVMYLIDYRKLNKLAPMLFGLAILALMYAGSSWPRLNMIAAASPFALVVVAGALLKRHNSNTPKDLAITTAIIGLPALLLQQVPSFTAAAIYLTATMVMLFSLRNDKKRFAIVTVTVAFILLTIVATMHPYAFRRLGSFLNPESDPFGAGFIPLRLTEAIQLGGPWGQRDMAQPGFIPEVHTDFIFTYLIYRYGWFTGLTLAVFAVILLLRLVLVCRSVREPVGKLICIGLTAIFSLHFVGNILMSLGKGPFLALAFPFISYSRLLLVTEIASLGIILGIYRRKDIISANEVSHVQEA